MKNWVESYKDSASMNYLSLRHKDFTAVFFLPKLCDSSGPAEMRDLCLMPHWIFIFNIAELMTNHAQTVRPVIMDLFGRPN